MKKKDNGKYYPTDEDFKHQYFCFKHNIAFSLRKASYDEDLYYVEKYDLRTPLKTTYFREDNNKPHMPSNRKRFKEYEAYVKIFECYKQQYDLILNIKKGCTSVQPFFIFYLTGIILQGELLQKDKHLHKYHTLCKSQGRYDRYHLQR